MMKIKECTPALSGRERSQALSTQGLPTPRAALFHPVRPAQALVSLRSSCSDWLASAVTGLLGRARKEQPLSLTDSSSSTIWPWEKEGTRLSCLVYPSLSPLFQAQGVCGCFECVCGEGEEKGG